MNVPTFYIAPLPTEEQIANAKIWGIDPYDLCGSLPIWDLRSDDTLAAPATIHDETCLQGGPIELGLLAASNFRRDCLICARAADGFFKRQFELSKALSFYLVVFLLVNKYWSTVNRNTPTTQAQGLINIKQAQAWINVCAQKIGEDVPYPLD